MNKQALSIIGIIVLIGGLIFINNNKKVFTHDWENQSVFNINYDR